MTTTMIARRALDRFRLNVSAPHAGRVLARRALHSNGGNATDVWVDLAFRYRYRGTLHPWPFTAMSVRPLQIEEEFKAVAAYLAENGVQRVLEIGTSSGGTLFVWSWIAGRTGMTVSLDLPEGEFAGSQPLGNEGYPHWRSALYESFLPAGHTLHLLKVDSHEASTVRKVEELAAGEPFDFLFIDGDHSYEGVRRDFEMYSPLVRPGGHVAFHDIVVRPPETQCEVERFWREVSQQYESREFVRDRDQGWGGIGVLTMS